MTLKFLLIPTINNESLPILNVLCKGFFLSWAVSLRNDEAAYQKAEVELKAVTSDKTPIENQ